MGYSGILQIIVVALKITKTPNLLHILEKGLEFLVTACESDITCHLPDEEFCRMKESISQCVHHIIGSLDQSSKLQTSSPVVRRFSKNSSMSFFFLTKVISMLITDIFFSSVVPVFPSSLSAETLSPLKSPMSSRKTSLQFSNDERLSNSLPTLPRRDSGNRFLSYGRIVNINL